MSQDKNSHIEPNNGHSNSSDNPLALNGAPSSQVENAAIETAEDSTYGRGRPLHRVAPWSGSAPDFYAGRYVGEEAGDGVNVQGVLSMLMRQWAVLLFTFLAVVGAGVTYTLLQRPVYQSAATIVISDPSSAPSGQSELLASLVGNAAPRSVGTQIAILNSAPVQRSALRRLPLMTRTVLVEFSRVEIRPQASAEAIDIVVSSHDRKAARDFANAICKEYIEQSRQQNREQVRLATQHASSQLGPLRERVKRAAAALKNYKEQFGVVNFDDQAKARVAQLSDLEAQLRQVRGERVSTAAQLNDIRTQVQQLIPVEERPERIVRNPARETLKAQLTQLDIKRIATLRSYRPGSREVTDIEKQMQDIRAQLDKQAQTEVGSWTQNVNPIRQNLLQDMARLQSQNWALEARAGAIESSVAQARLALGQLPEREYQLGQLTVDLETLRQTYRTLNDKYQALLISEQSRLANARIISPAEVPVVPISPRKTLNIIMSVLLGLLLSLMVAAFRDRLDDHVHSESDARLATGLPVLTQIPLLSGRNDSLITLPPSNPAVLESYRMLRTNLAFAALDEPLRSLVVTSSRPGEGKSTSAINIATVTALDGKQVILVDCDLRRPSLHTRLNLPNNMGLSNVLMGTATLEQALQPTKVPGLQVLTSGPLPPYPTELLNSHAAQTQLRQIFAAADLTVLDSPPALLIADAQILAATADATVLVVSFKDAKRRQIARTTEILGQTGTRLLGAVLNKLPMRLASTYSYNKQYYSNHTHSNGPAALLSHAETRPHDLQNNMQSNKREESEKPLAHRESS